MHVGMEEWKILLTCPTVYFPIYQDIIILERIERIIFERIDKRNFYKEKFDEF